MSNQSLYRYIVTDNPLHPHLESLELGESEREAILRMVEDIFHHRLLVVVLDHLDSSGKEEFVDLIGGQNHLATFDYLKQRIDNIEAKINMLVTEVHQDVITDILSIKEESNEST